MGRARMLAILILLAFTAVVPHKPAAGQAAPPAGTATAGKLTLTTSSPAAKAEFWQGLEDWQTGAYTSGVRHFRRASALDNGFALARLFSMGEYEAREHPMDRDRAVADAARQSTEEGLLALFWREKALGHPASSKALLRAAMQLMPNEPALATEYLWASNGEGNDLKRALDSARVLRTRFPDYTPLAFPIGFLAMRAGDTASALRAAEEYTRIAPRTPVSFSTYGGLLQQLGRFDEAEAQYRKGMAFLPAHPDYGWDPASALAELYILRGRNADARAVATEALLRAADASDSAMYMTELASTYVGTGDYRRAIQLLEQARQKSPTVGSAMNPQPLDYALAEVSALAGDLSSARSYLARRHPQTPTDSAILAANTAFDYGYGGQLDSAMAYSDRLAKITTVPWSGPWSHQARGVALGVAKQCSRAQSELAQVADTASLEVRTARADCELQLGNRTAALAVRDRAIASQDFTLLDPVYARFRVRLAQMK
ncbi:MAG: tetratricopeptide repeat protein [Gemmatimonadaceae bacterium]